MTKVKNELKMKLAPVHPGEILLEEFMKPWGLSQTRMAVIWASPPDASMKSSTAKEASPRTRL
jgi:hypothetical protein